MKYFVLVLAIVVLFIGPVMAADQGNVSKTTLAKMGLSNMTVVSDAQGTSVRGMGYAVVYGNSIAAVPGAVSSNGYFAVSKTCGATAAGLNVSAAIGSKCGCTTWVIAGGGSVAYAK